MVGAFIGGVGMQEELTYEEARKWYFFATDAYNVIRTMAERELKNQFEKNLVVLFIDCYDLISFLFPRGMLMYDEHYDWNRTLWNQTFETLHGNDNLKICVSPPSCLELFHFLERKAYYVYKGAPVITKEDEKNSTTFLRKLWANQYALSLTDVLLDKASKKVPHLLKLEDLIKKKKMINACEVFDYSKPDWQDFVKIVSAKFESQRAEEFLRKQRVQYLSQKKGRIPVDLGTVGVDQFSVNIDISNIAQTIYIDSLVKDTKFTFTSHGIYLILCCHRDRGYWKDEKEEAPVMNSLLALYLAKALREFRSYEEAHDFFLGAKFAFRNYLKEFIKLLRKNSELKDYIRNPDRVKIVGAKTLQKHDKFMNAELYLLEYCSDCFPGMPSMSPDNLEITATGAKYLKEYNEDEVLRFARDEEFRRARGEDMLKAAKETIGEVGIFTPDRVAEYYFPPGEVTSKLLLKLSGYSFHDWE